MSEADQIAAILEAWLVGDSNDVYQPFLKLVVATGSVDDVLERLPLELQGHLRLWLHEHVDDMGSTLFALVPGDSDRVAELLLTWANGERERTYAEASRMVDQEDLHELVAEQGPTVLGHNLPYVIQACRWRGIDRHRRAAREIPFAEKHAQLAATTESAFESLAADERLDYLRSALAQLGNVDLMIVWKTAEGTTDAEIARELTLSVEAVRQRRHRAILKLRRVLRTQ